MNQDNKSRNDEHQNRLIWFQVMAWRICMCICYNGNLKYRMPSDYLYRHKLATPQNMITWLDQGMFGISCFIWSPEDGLRYWQGVKPPLKLKLKPASSDCNQNNMPWKPFLQSSDQHEHNIVTLHISKVKITRGGSRVVSTVCWKPVKVVASFLSNTTPPPPSLAHSSHIGNQSRNSSGSATDNWWKYSMRGFDSYIAFCGMAFMSV